MDSLYNTYLKMLTTPFDDPSSDLPDISPEDLEKEFKTNTKCVGGPKG